MVVDCQLCQPNSSQFENPREEFLFLFWSYFILNPSPNFIAVNRLALGVDIKKKYFKCWFKQEGTLLSDLTRVHGGLLSARNKLLSVSTTSGAFSLVKFS